MRYILIALLALTGCSLKSTAPIFETSGDTPFSLAYTESGEGLRVTYNAETCQANGTVIEPQEFVIPLSMIEKKERTLLERLIDNVADTLLMFGAGFWIGAD